MAAKVFWRSHGHHIELSNSLTEVKYDHSLMAACMERYVNLKFLLNNEGVADYTMSKT